MGNARMLVWVALAGQVVSIVSWVVAGALEPGYSHIEQGVSELGARDAAHAWIANGGIVVHGLSLVAIGLALFAVLRSRVALALFVLAGLAVVAEGLITLDCGLSDGACEAMWHAGRLSWHEDGHLWAGFAGQLFLALTPFAVARALWPGPVAPLAFGAGMFGLAVGVLSHLVYESSDTDGLVQRFGLLLVLVWVVIVAVGVLHASRREPAPGRLVRVRPRDFFAGEWEGSGELVPWPSFLWRRVARPFSARRRATWISDRAWRFDDEADFGGGRVQRRRAYCEFVADDRVSVTAGDLPEGASVWIEDEGYRMVPFRMAFPIGPLAVPMLVHDVSWVDDDGTLVNTFEARDVLFGLPLGRVAFRVRPIVGASGDGQAR